MSNDVNSNTRKNGTPNQGLKMVLEMGPLLAFFLVNAKWGIFAATAVFMAVAPVAITLAWFKTRHVPVMPLVGGVFIMVFGGLTLALEDDTFIKLKPTIVNTLFAVALFSGLAMKRLFLKVVLESAIQLNDEGWRKLTWRWGFFFLLLATLNEIVWRTQTTDMWVNFKVFGIMPLTLVFGMTQLPLIFRYQLAEESKDAN